MAHQRPVGVFVFGQAGCSHCAIYIPRFKRLAAPYRQHYPIGVYDLGAQDARAQQLANSFSIRVTPTTVVMDGSGLHKHAGVLTDAAIMKLLEDLVH